MIPASLSLFSYPLDTHPIDQILKRLVQLYGNKPVVDVDIFEVIHITQAVINGLDLELAPWVRLELEDLAAERQVFRDSLEAPILAGRVELAAWKLRVRRELVDWPTFNWRPFMR